MASGAGDPQARVLQLISSKSPRPTELLQLLKEELSYREIQDAVRALLDSGYIELGSDRQLRVTKIARAS
jgi:hypothetical protein